ncbi:oligopeptide ABC superfamily ATP binding cassette transporter, ABC protein [Staphylococcus saccharolyticus]|uniref:Oligopeptide ABC superfamily ATP binding cassette transporter, ABC protein n=1 Tax=Staphylococcus saccharolyticus TaxID=33028 RepID=A0A380H6A9_9STAP|nr:oligopeptide ABC superfamily ATP binding cassette transporter, ABC protein [Staphylococcus saccharolyticus]
MNNVLEVKKVKKYYELKTGLFQKRQYVKTVDDVTFSIEEGQTFGLVGESGCGKSTIGKTIVRLENVTCGEIKICGENITHIKGKN